MPYSDDRNSEGVIGQFVYDSVRGKDHLSHQIISQFRHDSPSARKARKHFHPGNDCIPESSCCSRIIRRDVADQLPQIFQG